MPVHFEPGRQWVEVIDLYQIHWPNSDEHIEEGWTTLAELKGEGKVRYIRVGFEGNPLGSIKRMFF